MNHQAVGTGDAGLTPAELTTLRENLDEQRQFRLEQLAQLGGTAPPRAQSVREQRAAAQLEVHIKLLASARMVLADVEAALERMERGGYGICHLCRRPITVPRLRIVPQARYCARCHHVREANG
ncbi:TraR/DksA family transcriptional regulator [Streptomyces sp. NPDC008313]|uniref:TraR/DksA family transcriptional regulator n=1 Tax=Streptomyces sp. NPDC008313 TaxID=3364826 RepID=UPI0036EA3902